MCHTVFVGIKKACKFSRLSEGSHDHQEYYVYIYIYPTLQGPCLPSKTPKLSLPRNPRSKEALLGSRLPACP